ncbi:MAG: hypothetical protein ISQ34_01240 [Rickettsiales bacterium]|nr:hypothetical protein [Rickettsiales bacterium]
MRRFFNWIRGGKSEARVFSITEDGVVNLDDGNRKQVGSDGEGDINESQHPATKEDAQKKICFFLSDDSPVHVKMLLNPILSYILNSNLLGEMEEENEKEVKEKMKDFRKRVYGELEIGNIYIVFSKLGQEAFEAYKKNMMS